MRKCNLGLCIVSIGVLCCWPVLGDDSFEGFASRPTAAIVWSNRTAAIDSDPSHAVVTALVVEDATQATKRRRGIRIDLRNAEGEDHVYADENQLTLLMDALGEITAGLPRFLASAAGARENRCFGSGALRN